MSTSPAERVPRRQSHRGRVSLLNGQMTLGDVESAEALCRKVLDDRLRWSSAYLNPTEYDDALSYLLAECWNLYRRYDPDKGTQAFSTFAYRILWRRVPSWYRQRFGDTRYRAKPTWVSLEDDDLETIAAGWEWEDVGTPMQAPRYTAAALGARFGHLNAAQIGELVLKANQLDDERRGTVAQNGLYERINEKQLSPESQRILEMVARPMIEEDLSLEQIADRRGFSRRWVSRALERLREELGPMLKEDV